MRAYVVTLIDLAMGQWFTSTQPLSAILTMGWVAFYKLQHIFFVLSFRATLILWWLWLSVHVGVYYLQKLITSIFCIHNVYTNLYVHQAPNIQESLLKLLFLVVIIGRNLNVTIGLGILILLCYLTFTWLELYISSVFDYKKFRENFKT